MSEFQTQMTISSHTVFKIHSTIKSVAPRGGSAVVQLEEGSIIAFGGVDREQCHFQDLIVYSTSQSKGLFEVVRASGDVPTPRTGHSLAAYGRFVLLFGGLDFSEEAAYNDLYLLDTLSWEWSYVGEAGIEILARNSHSMVILENPSDRQKILVVYGGASPDRGILGDTIYAFLPPDPNAIDPKTFFVEWRELAASEISPGPREMHSTTKHGNSHMLISGGRSGEGSTLLRDIWQLSVISPAPSSAVVSSSSSAGAGSCEVLKWHQLSVPLSQSRCSHSTVVVNFDSSAPLRDAASRQHVFAVLGGFTDSGISEEMDLSLLIEEGTAESYDTAISLAGTASAFSLEGSLGKRFGQAFCSLSLSFVMHLYNNERYRPVLSTQPKLNDMLNRYSTQYQRENYPSVIVGLLIFGGVDADQDFADVWMVLFSPQ